MAQSNSTRKEWLLRLSGEFAIIVLGVLCALAADSWVRSGIDRSVERIYLERFLDDIRYDIEEYEFVLTQYAKGDSASSWLFELAVDGELESTNPNELPSAVFMAALNRSPDLSRGTWEEALASGRIALVQNQEVLSALASYDRSIRESEGAWQNNLELPLFIGAKRTLASVFERMGIDGCMDSTFAERCNTELLPIERRLIRDLVSSDEFIGDLNESRFFRGFVGTVINTLLLPEARRLESALLLELDLPE
jgi:hypothetical protein